MTTLSSAIRSTGHLAALGIVICSAGCASSNPPPPVQTGFLSTYRHLDQTAPNTWRYIEPSNRLARYDKFIVAPVEVRLAEGATGWKTSAGDLKAVADYMQQAMISAVSDAGYQVVQRPGAEVAEIRVAITDAYDKGNHIGIAVEGEMVDSVSRAQVGALVESQRGQNLTINRFWQEHDAKKIMDNWASRLRTVIDDARAGA
jgi:hypothetical protein